MIRRSSLSLKFANKHKAESLSAFMDESIRVLNLLIPIIWKTKDINKFQLVPEVETWLSARMKQCLLKQAVETVKSQRNKRKKTMPVVKSKTLTLDERFVAFKEDQGGMFDLWVHLQSLGNKVILNLPTKKHVHFNKFKNDGWVLKNGGRLRETPKGFVLDVFFEKEAPAIKTKGTQLGVDLGYKKLIACSDGSTFGEDLTKIYEKISNKKQGSRNFKQALIERDHQVNRSVKQLPLKDVRLLVAEALKNIKKGVRGKKTKEFNNRLSRWTYPKVLGRLQMLCEETGVEFIQVNPAYTSQTCSKCGLVDKNSRKGEQFLCTGCGMGLDADVNAAKNILQRGAYSPPSQRALP
jgi:putative transposase